MRRRVRKINGRIVREFEMNFPMIISIQEIQILFVILSSNHHHRPFHKFLLISSRNTSKTITFVSLNRHYLITIIKYVFTQPNILFITQRSLSLTFLLPQETDLSPSFPYLENNYSCFVFYYNFYHSLDDSFSQLSSFLPSFLPSLFDHDRSNPSTTFHRGNTVTTPATRQRSRPSCLGGSEIARVGRRDCPTPNLENFLTRQHLVCRLPPPIPDRGRKTRYWMERETEREKRRRRIRFRAWDGEARRCPRAKLP